MNSVRFKVRYGSGMPENVAGWAVPRGSGFLDLANEELRIADIGIPAHSSRLNEQRRPNETRRMGVYRLADLRFIAYEAVGSKSNVGALALFGVLGLGARKDWALLTVGFGDRDAQFITQASVHEVRGKLQAVAESSPTLKSLLIEGRPPTVDQEPSAVTPSTELDEIERLAKLYQDGLLTLDEYSRIKTKLLNEH